MRTAELNPLEPNSAPYSWTILCLGQSSDEVAEAMVRDWPVLATLVHAICILDYNVFIQMDDIDQDSPVRTVVGAALLLSRLRCGDTEGRQFEHPSLEDILTEPKYRNRTVRVPQTYSMDKPLPTDAECLGFLAEIMKAIPQWALNDLRLVRTTDEPWGEPWGQPWDNPLEGP